MNIEIKNFESSRTVYLSTDIDEDSLLQLKRDFNSILDKDFDVMRDNCAELSKLGEQYVNVFKSGGYPPIVLDINSPGGSIYDALGMYDFIRRIIDQAHIEIICRINGLAASAATIVMLACDKRYASPNTHFMLHSISATHWGKLQELRDDLEQSNKLNEILLNIYTSRTNIKMEKLKEIEEYKKDWWINTKEALELGLITQIN